MSKGYEQASQKEKKMILNKQIKRCSTSLANKKWKLKQ